MHEIGTFPVGARVLIRDAEWQIKRVDAVKGGGVRLTCLGVSDFVKGRQALFLTCFEEEVRLLLPEETRLVPDDSPQYRKTRLYLEALLRNTPQTDDTKIRVGHKAAMDPMPYQFDPALQALSQTRPRILIADAVGIGKTLEAGILASELICRGRGRRILVLATKAMLSQFQQEFWNRFTIALVRLDSDGIQRVRNKLPTNHNPFLYFDRSIISIDTLKQSEYRDYLEKAYWDIIIIDEAHNVAVRSTRSQRAILATMLAGRSDTLIMLSATPHDGKAESFASLLNMLDPMALPDNSQYSADDFAEKGLVIRRFKHHIKDQVDNAFQKREIATEKAIATPAEERVYDYLSTVRFKTLDRENTSGAHLFATTLIKAMFSSPAACLSVIENRRRKLESGKNRKAVAEDIAKLDELEVLVGQITDEQFSKLNLLVELLGDGEKSLHWNREDPHDRLVIFTESVVTLQYLKKVLPALCGLQEDQYRVLSGSMQDTEIAKIVREFNQENTPVRLLLCSDVASEGINLHHYAHRMVHFDIPWSLMTFQQRNGRIDRYGQRMPPQIRYLQTQANIERCIGDVKILEKLVEKDENAQKNIADPAEFLLTQQEQEDLTASRMEGREEPETENTGEESLFDMFFGEEKDGETNQAAQAGSLSHVMDRRAYENHLDRPFSFYGDDFSYATDALNWMNRSGMNGSESHAGNGMGADVLKIDEQNRQILLQAPPDLLARLKYLPAEVLPDKGRFDLTDDRRAIQQEIAHARTNDDPWPAKQLLWPLHPVMTWIDDRLLTMFGRHSAPVVSLATLHEGETWVLIQGGFPNRRGYIPVHEWVAVHAGNGGIQAKSLDELLKATRFGERMGNLARQGDAVQYETLYGDTIREAVKIAREKLLEAKDRFNGTVGKRLNEKLGELESVRNKRRKQIEQASLDGQIEQASLDGQIELNFGGQPQQPRRKRNEKALGELETTYEEAKRYIDDIAQTEKEPYLQLVALFVGMEDGKRTDSKQKRME